MAVRNPRELHDLNQYKPGLILGGRWTIIKLLDEGGFGRVYQVGDQKRPGFFAALKIESINMDGGSAIKLEKSALMQIHKRGSRAHVPILYRTSKRKNICYMIVTLLGDNLKRLKDKYFPDGYSLRTWSRIAIQCLYAIKVVHDSGFVHRDIKACNFMLGSTLDAKRARMVHILDFGLARQWAFEDKRGNGYKPRRARPTCDFRGTFCFAAPSMHDGVEQGRKDDLWSYLYLLIDIYAGLPWGRIDNDAALASMKQNMRDEDLLIRMPAELLPIPKHLRTLEYYSRPNYTLVFNCLEKIMKRCNVSFLDSYEWETKAQIAANKSAILNDYPGYIEAGPFFDEDPLGINEGPSATTLSSATTPTKHGRTSESAEDVDDMPMKGGRRNKQVSIDCSISFRAGSNNNTTKKNQGGNRASKMSKQQRKKATPSKKAPGSKETSREDVSKECTKDDDDDYNNNKKKRGGMMEPSSSTPKGGATPKKKKDRDRSVEDGGGGGGGGAPRSVYMTPYGGKT